MASEYEQLRLERIKANEAFLAELDVAQDKGTLERNKRKAKPAATKTKRTKSAAQQAVEPARRSSRLSGKEAESLYILSASRGKVLVGGQPPTMRPELDSSGAPVAMYDLKGGGFAPARQKTRFEDQVLDLGLRADQMDKSGSDFFAALKTAAAEGGGVATHSKGALAYSERLSKLECTAAVKITPARAYAVAFHPQVPVVCAGDRDGNIGLLRYTESDLEADSASLEYKPHVSTVNALACAETMLYSFSYDGTVRAMDLGKPGTFQLAFKSTANAAKDVWLQHGVLSASGKTMYVAMSDGHVVHASVNAGKPIWSFAAHDKKVQTVSASPDERLLATASLDRSIKVWDLRKCGGAKPKPLCTFQDSHSINSCTFNPTGSKLVAVAMSNKLHLFAHPDKTTGDSLNPTRSVRHDNRTGRYLAVFHAAWDPKEPDAFIVGSMAQPRRVEVYSADNDELNLVMNLSGDLLGSVQSRSAFHPTLDLIACANASGRLHLFQ